MNAYILKLKGSNELVGIAVAENVQELQTVADEVCDPNSCVYQAIEPQRGGMLLKFSGAGDGRYWLNDDVGAGWVDLVDIEDTDLLWDLLEKEHD